MCPSADEALMLDVRQRRAQSVAPASRDARARAKETLAMEFRKPQWARVSADAKRVLECMLRTDPRARVTAERAFSRTNGSGKTAALVR